MSRFFKTAKSQFIDDKIFKIPTNLAAQVIKSQDGVIDGNIKKLDDFSASLQVENLNVDNPAVNQRITDLKGRIDNFAQDLTTSPLEFRKRQAELGQFSRELQNDLNKGLLGQAQNQLKDLTGFDKSLEDLKDVSQERKDLVKRAVRQRYNSLGGLDFKDANTFNAIQDSFETPLNEFDEEKFIKETGTNFVADKVSRAGASADGKGYIRTSTRDIEIRSEKDVEDYVSEVLSNGEWEAQKRQLYNLKKELGELDENASVEELVERDKQSVINRAKNRLGYKKETNRQKLASDNTFLKNLDSFEKNIKAGAGTILTEVRDPRKNYRGKDMKIKYSPQDIASFEAMDKKVKGLLELGEPSEIVKNIYENPDSINNIKELKKKLSTVGMTHNEFVNYLNYQNSIENWETPHKDGYDTEDRRDVAEQRATLDRLVTGFNNLNPNEDIKTIRVSRSDGSYEELPYDNLGRLIEDDAENQFIYVPVTGTNQEKILKRNPAGNLVDSEGDALINPNTGQPITTLEQAQSAGVSNDLVFDTEKIPTFDTTKNLITANRGNFKQNQKVQLNAAGMVKKEKDYIVSNSFYRTNKETGRREIVNLDVIIDSKKLKVNNN